MTPVEIFLDGETRGTMGPDVGIQKIPEINAFVSYSGDTDSMVHILFPTEKRGVIFDMNGSVCSAKADIIQPIMILPDGANLLYRTELEIKKI